MPLERFVSAARLVFVQEWQHRRRRRVQTVGWSLSSTAREREPESKINRNRYTCARQLLQSSGRGRVQRVKAAGRQSQFRGQGSLTNYRHRPTETALKRDARGRATDAVRGDTMHEVELQTLSGETPCTRQSYRRCPGRHHARGRATDAVRGDTMHEAELQTLSGETPCTRQSYRRCPGRHHARGRVTDAVRKTFMTQRCRWSCKRLLRWETSRPKGCRQSYKQ